MPSSRKSRSRHRSHRQHQKQKAEDHEIEANLRHGPLPDSDSSVAWAMEPLPAQVEGPSVLKEDFSEGSDSVPRGIKRKVLQEASNAPENVAGLQLSSKRKKGAASMLDFNAAPDTPSSMDRWDGGDLRGDETLSLLTSLDAGRGGLHVPEFMGARAGDFDSLDAVASSYGGQSEKDSRSEGEGKSRKGKARATLASESRPIPFLVSESRPITVIDMPGVGQVDASLGDTNIRIKNKVSRRRDASEIESEKSNTEIDPFAGNFSKGQQQAGSNLGDSGRTNSKKTGAVKKWDKDSQRKGVNVEAQHSHVSDSDSLFELGRKTGKSHDAGIHASPRSGKVEELSKPRKSEESQMPKISEDVMKGRDEAEAVEDHGTTLGETSKMNTVAEWILQEGHRNLELEKELENRIRRRREESGDRDRWKDDEREREGKRHHYQRDYHQREDRYKDDSRPRDDKLKDDRRWDEKTRDTRTKDDKDRGDGRHRDERDGRNVEEKRREDRQKVDKEPEERCRDANETYEKHRVEKDRDDRHSDDKYREERHREDTHKDEKDRDDRHKEDKDSRRRDGKVRDIRHKSDKEREDRFKDEKDSDERPKDEKHKEERVRNGKDCTERARDNKDLADRPRDEKERSGRQRDKDEKAKDKDRENRQRDDKYDKHKDELERNDDPREEKHKDERHNNDRDQDDGSMVHKLQENRQMTDKIQELKEKEIREKDVRCREEQGSGEPKDERLKDNKRREDRNQADSGKGNKDRSDRTNDDRERYQRPREDRHEKRRVAKEDGFQDNKYVEDRVKPARSSEKHDGRHQREDRKQTEGEEKDAKHQETDQGCAPGNKEPYAQSKEYDEKIGPSCSHEQGLRENFLEKKNAQEGDHKGMKAAKDDAYEHKRLLGLPASSGIADASKGEHGLKMARESFLTDSIILEKDYTRPRGRQDSGITGSSREERSLRHSRDERDSTRSQERVHNHSRELDDVRNKIRADQHSDDAATESRVKNIRSPQYESKISLFPNLVDASPRPNGWQSPLDAGQRSPSPSLLDGNNVSSFDKSARSSRFEASVSSSSGARRQRERNKQLGDHIGRVKQHYGLDEEVKSWEPRVLPRDSDDGRGRSVSPERNLDSLLSLPLIGAPPSGQEEFSRNSMRGSAGYEESTVLEHEHRRSFSQGAGPTKLRVDDFSRERTEWLQHGLQMNRSLGGPIMRPQLSALPSRPLGPLGLLPPPPPFRPGIDNPAILGPPNNTFEEGIGPREGGRYDRKAVGSFKRAEMGGGPGPVDAWRGMGMSNWNTQNQGPGPSNIFSPFPPQVGIHPSGGFIGRGQQFMVPPLFGPGGGARPSSEMVFSGARFHVGDSGGGFHGHGPLMGWHRPEELDETRRPHLQGPLDAWEGQGPFADERQRYARQEWDRGTQGLNEQGWERGPDVWQSHGGDISTGVNPLHLHGEASCQSSFGGDEAMAVLQDTQAVDTKLPQEKSSSEVAEATDFKEMPSACASEVPIFTSPLTEVKPAKRSITKIQALLSNLDVSSELCGSDLYQQYLSLLPPSEAKRGKDVVILDAFTDAAEDDFEFELDPEAQALISPLDLYSQFLPPLEDNVFKEVLSVYQKPAQENRAQKSVLGTFLLPLDSSLLKTTHTETEIREDSSPILKDELEIFMDQVESPKAIQLSRAETVLWTDSSGVFNTELEISLLQHTVLEAIGAMEVHDGILNHCNNSTKDASRHYEIVDVEQREQEQGNLVVNHEMDDERNGPSALATDYVGSETIMTGSPETLRERISGNAGFDTQQSQFKCAISEDEMQNDMNGVDPQGFCMAGNSYVHLNDLPVETLSAIEVFSEPDKESGEDKWVDTIPLADEQLDSLNCVERVVIETEEPIAVVTSALDNPGDSNLNCAEADFVRDTANAIEWAMTSWDDTSNFRPCELLDDELSRHEQQVEGKGKVELQGAGLSEITPCDIRGDFAVMFSKEAAGEFEEDEVKGKSRTQQRLQNSPENTH